MFTMASPVSGLSYIYSLTKQLFLSSAVVMASEASSVTSLWAMLSSFSLLLSFNVLNNVMAALLDSSVQAIISSSSIVEGLVNME